MTPAGLAIHPRWAIGMKILSNMYSSAATRYWRDTLMPRNTRAPAFAGYWLTLMPVAAVDPSAQASRRRIKRRLIKASPASSIASAAAPQIESVGTLEEPRMPDMVMKKLSGVEKPVRLLAGPKTAGTPPIWVDPRSVTPAPNVAVGLLAPSGVIDDPPTVLVGTQTM